MAKRVNSSVASMSIAELNREIGRRRRALPSLQRRRDKLVAKLNEIDRMIAELGGPRGARHGGSGSGPRGDNDGTLADYLRRALTNATMGVTEVANAVQSLGYKTNSPNFRTIVNAALMSKKHGFKRVSRGKYTVA